MMNTDPAWGQEYIPEELKKKLTTKDVQVIKTMETDKIDINKIEQARQQLIAQSFIETEPDVFTLKNGSEWTIISIDKETGMLTKTKYTKVITEDTMWAIHGYYTRDLNLET